MRTTFKPILFFATAACTVSLTVQVFAAGAGFVNKNVSAGNAAQINTLRASGAAKKILPQVKAQAAEDQDANCTQYVGGLVLDQSAQIQGDVTSITIVGVASNVCY